MPLDDFIPEYDVVERHETMVHATPAQAWAAVEGLDFCASPIVKLLFTLRGMPARGMTLAGFESFGFVRLAETPGDEILLGLVGQFWKPAGAIVRVDADRFRDYAEPGQAKAVMSFAVEPSGEGTRVTTETRVLCTDERARKSFRRYWRLIAPFSGWTRREALRLVRKAAEAGVDAKRTGTPGA
jgi:hypothetical protein